MKNVITILIAWIIWFAIFASLLGFFAKKRNRNPWPWVIIGGLVGPFTGLPTLIALFATSPLCQKCKQPLNTNEWKTKKCPKCDWSGKTR